MDEEHTTAAVQRYLHALAGDSPSEPVIRALLDRAVRRLHKLCAPSCTAATRSRA
jgi:RNA polymerase sigma-70 factor (ECF subfamily)